MRQFGTSGMDLYVLDERVVRVSPHVESVPESIERRSTWALLGHALRSGFARVR